MKRLIGFLVAVAVAGVMAPGAFAQAPKTMNAQGTVSAVTTDSLTVKGSTEELKFMIDKDTSVVAKGATHKSLALKADGKATVLTDFVKAGDRVTVSYHEMGGMKHAATINVTSAPPAR